MHIIFIVGVIPVWVGYLVGGTADEAYGRCHGVLFGEAKLRLRTALTFLSLLAVKTHSPTRIHPV